jgi:DEAD/DEAH box helicase domain-containing protein
MFFEVIFDLETKRFFDETGTNDPADLGVSIVSLYSRSLDESFVETEGRMASFFEKDFGKMWEIFAKANRVVGFNSLHFDVPALRPYAPLNFARLAHFDLLAVIKEKLGFRVGLNKIAMETLGVQKTDHGSEAIDFWQKGDLGSLERYCESDVAITRDIYDFGRKNKFIKFRNKWNEVQTVDVDFSYSLASQSVQKGLF